MRSKKAIYNVVCNLLLQIVILVNGFIVPKIIINSYGSNVNGLVSSITQFLGYISLLDSGFTAVVKSQLYKPLAKKDNSQISLILKSANKFFHSIALVFVFYIIILSMVYPLLVNTGFDYIFSIGLIIILSISMLSEYYFGMTFKLLLQADQKNHIVSIIQIVVYVLSIIVTLLLAKMNVSILVLKFFVAIVFLLRPLIQLFYIKRKYDVNLNVSGKYNIKNRWDGFAQHIAFVIHSNTDIAVLTIFTSLKEVSVYSVYLLMVKGIKSIMQAFINGFDAVFGDMIARGEADVLRKKFSSYEVLYNTIGTIAFSCALVLVTPFVEVYTAGVVDADYVRPLFGILIVISEYIWVIRQPYNTLIKAAGHFKQTRIGAWVECVVNIIISIILVMYFGLVGVAIGTIVAMLIRAIEFVFYVNVRILKRNIWISVGRIALVIFETIAIVLVSNALPFLENTSYLNWGVNALMTGIVAISITLIVNMIVFRKEFMTVKALFNHKTKNNTKRMD